MMLRISQKMKLRKYLHDPSVLRSVILEAISLAVSLSRMLLMTPLSPIVFQMNLGVLMMARQRPRVKGSQR